MTSERCASQHTFTFRFLLVHPNSFFRRVNWLSGKLACTTKSWLSNPWSRSFKTPNKPSIASGANFLSPGAACVGALSTIFSTRRYVCSDPLDIRSERSLKLAYWHIVLPTLFSALNVLCDSCTAHREYADQLKTSRDELAAASRAEVGSATLTTLEKRTLLTQKASLEKMATETRR